MPAVDVSTVPKVAFVSLGCPKNLVDSEVLLGHLVQDGFYVCEQAEDADVVVVNTCCFIRDSENESLAAIERALALKRAGACRGVVVAGCMPQRYGPELAERLGEVDAFLGIVDREKIVALCRELLNEDGPPLGRAARMEVRRDLGNCDRDVARLRLTPAHYAYVRVSEGCDHTCAFCVIPKIRGAHRSKTLEVILEEVRELAADGAREIILIAQDTGAYGADLYRRRSLPELLRRIADVRGVDWIRVLYAHPAHLTPDLIDALASIPQMAPYLDLPTQHVSDRMLSRMRRGYSKARLLDIIETLRSRIPDISLRTTVIVGHPGETEADVEELIEVMRSVRFEHLGAFAYSNEPGCRAEAMDGHVPEDEKARRHARVMGVQRAIAFARNRTRVGSAERVIVDAAPRPGRGGRGRTGWIGRTVGDAPDIDGTIVLSGDGLKVGRILTARVTGARGYDLIGRPE